MKTAAVSLLLASLVCVGVAAAQTVEPGAPKQITITATTVDVRARESMRSDTMLLWNKNVTPKPIGHAILACQFAGADGILGSGASSCMGTYVLPLGKITTQGIIHGYNRYVLVITGGSGAYKGVSGTLFAKRINNGVRRLVFTL